MTYCISGLDPAQFASYFGLDDKALEDHRARRMTATSGTGFPCRVSLHDAEEGEELLLINHVNHDVETPYRNAFAIYVRANAGEAARFVDEVPPVMQGRPIALRGYTVGGMLEAAELAMPDKADETIRQMLDNPQIAYIDAHNAAYGCFAARVTRHV
ncbi:DUF1203 domain-containing protein [Erythrobacter alti]|uniref:DUF1203 domain-containing protein n=1 Tax=Erythrobacter alti TaxID=1896145 RepID=UPI0030F47BAF